MKNRCRRCGALLTDPLSRRWGYGPECANQLEIMDRDGWDLRTEVLRMEERDTFKRWLRDEGFYEVYYRYLRCESAGKFRREAA